MNTQNQEITKPRIGLYSIFVRRLNQIKVQTEVIPFPKVFEKICTNFSIKKEECWEILFTIKEQGIIDIIPGHGVRIKEQKRIMEVREELS